MFSDFLDFRDFPIRGGGTEKTDLAKVSAAPLRFDWADFQPKPSVLDQFRL